MPGAFKLEQNYPNPFNPSTVIGYRLPVAGYVTLKIYDVLGGEVATLVNKYQQAGNYTITFPVQPRYIASVPGGIYFYRLTSGNFSQTKKMLMIK